MSDKLVIALLDSIERMRVKDCKPNEGQQVRQTYKEWSSLMPDGSKVKFLRNVKKV